MTKILSCLLFTFALAFGGCARDDDERDAIEQHARAVSGVRSVDNLITVRD